MVNGLGPIAAHKGATGGSFGAGLLTPFLPLPRCIPDDADRLNHY
jgi:hypothetical protein